MTTIQIIVLTAALAFGAGFFTMFFLNIYMDARDAKAYERHKLQEEQKKMWADFLNRLGGQNG